MDITERIKNYKPWTCPNCNKRYKNPEKEMELIGTVYDRIKRKITDVDPSNKSNFC